MREEGRGREGGEGREGRYVEEEREEGGMEGSMLGREGGGQSSLKHTLPVQVHISLSGSYQLGGGQRYQILLHVAQVKNPQPCENSTRIEKPGPCAINTLIRERIARE